MMKITAFALLSALSAVSTTKAADPYEFWVSASGDQENPPVTTDTTASFHIEFAADLSSFDFDLEVYDGVGITAAHLHCAVAGSNGPVIFGLASPGGANVNGELASATITDLGKTTTCPSGFVINNIASLLQAVLNNEVYVNVHSQAHPSGVVRGQIINAPESCEDICVDFDGFMAGDYVTDELTEDYGVVIKAVPAGKKGYAPGGAARIFDSSDPRADPDLGSPNESCPGGGPGVGLGGAPNATYPNCEPLGNVLIIQEKDKKRADDSRTGGSLVFDFETLVNLYDVTIVDIDDPDGASVEVMDADGVSTSFSVPMIGDNGVYILSVDLEDVEKMSVTFGGSGAVAKLCYELCEG